MRVDGAAPVPPVAGQPSGAGTPPPAPVGQPPAGPPDPEAERAAAAVRQQTEMRRQQEAFKQREQQFNKERADFENARKLIATDPEAAAKMLGFDYDKWTQHRIGAKQREDQKKKDGPQYLTRDDLDAYFEERDKAREQKENEVAEQRFRGEMASFVVAHKDAYETMGALDDGTGLMGFIRQYQEKTGRWVEPEEAAPLFEKELDGLVEKVLELPKWKKIYAKSQQPAAPAPGEKSAAPAAKSEGKPAPGGLGNGVGPTGAGGKDESPVDDDYSDEARTKRARAAFDKVVPR